MRATGLSQADMQLLRSMAVTAVLLSGTVGLGIVLDSLLPLLALPAVVLALAYVYLRFGADGTGIPSVSPATAEIDDDAGLPSPLLAEHFVAKEFAAARRGRDVTLVMFGFSRFDEFSEREGSTAAADALREFGRILQQMTRQMNLSARYGWRADAFLSVLSDANAMAAEGFIARVRNAVALLNMPVPEIEVGVAVYQPHLASPEEFVECAEQALAAARASSNVAVNR
jgi:diguanylate cyclase (GGDEF)-like protein